MKKFIIIFLILLLIITSGVIYLNKVVLPTKIKSLLVASLKKQTGKDVMLKSLEFDIFKGFILHDLVISDSQNVIISSRQATCAIFIWPIFKKQIIIPGIHLKSPYIFLERRADNSFNLQDLFSPPKQAEKKSDFNVTVLKISVTQGSVVFQDDTLPVKLRKEIKNIQFNLSLTLPASVKFNFKGQISNTPAVNIQASGQYKILNRQLLANVLINNLPIAEFKAYYGNSENLISGLVDLQAKINLKDKLLAADLIVKGNNLVLKKEGLGAILNPFLQAKINYDLQAKKLSYEGSCNILKADISGVQILGKISNLHGKFAFNQRSLVADSLKAELLGQPFEIKLGIKDFNTPVLNIKTDLDLNFLPQIAKEKYKFSLINFASGKAALSIKIYPNDMGQWLVQGDLGITEANLKLEKQENWIENIFATVEFSQAGFNWKDTKFKYQGVNYETDGVLSNFASPDIKLKLYSPDLSLAADFNLSASLIKFAQLKGKYLDSQFSASGQIDNSDAARPFFDLNGLINLEVNNLTSILDKKYPALKSMQLSGQLDTQFSLRGYPSDFKNCYLQAKLTSNNFSFYGLNTKNLSAEFFQDQRLAKMSSLKIDFYEGVIEGVGSLNLDTAGMPYQVELKANGIKLEKLKMDTPVKNKNISGNLVGEIKFNGYSADLNKINGLGSFLITNGKLWELNLLQGLGKLLFASDLGNIEFSECSSSFLIKDKFISTDKLILKSNIANLVGPLRIGFDNSLDGVLDVEILSDMVPVSGTLKDLTTAIIGQAGKFGEIKLSGTLKEPKYHFKTAVTNIIKGITDVLFGK